MNEDKNKNNINNKNINSDIKNKINSKNNNNDNYKKMN